MESYETVTRIGKGACGSVYLVRNKETKKLYALKKIQLDEGRPNRTKTAVHREVKILSQLKHPNIVAYQDSFFDEMEENLCILQDYCDGGTLDDKIIQARGKGEFFQEKQIMQWFIQITMAVQFMHSQKILHRDLKTQNVFLTKTGQTCKLGDFGISKMLDQTIDAAQTCVGTPCYLSPEMCQDIPYTSKADVWALGCMLYEMCALKPAFDANNLISLFYKIVKAEFEDIPDRYSSKLNELVREILIKSPEDRPSARGVLNLSYVKENLSKFIEEKEYLIQLKQLKDSPHTTLDRQTSRSTQASNTPPSSRPSSVRATPVPTISKASPEIRAPSAKDNAVSQTDSGIQICEEQNPRQGSGSVKADTESHLTSPVEPTAHRVSPLTLGNEAEYPDDFDEESSESDDDIPEDLPEGREASDQSDAGDDEQGYDYPDDFEEYASEDELDNVVSHARDIQQIQAGTEDEMLVDEHRPGLVEHCKNLLQEHCIAALGKERYDEVRRLGEKSNFNSQLRPTFERMVGSEHVETCYLVSELLSEDT